MTQGSYQSSHENVWKDTEKHQRYLLMLAEQVKEVRPQVGDWIVAHDAETGESIRIQVGTGKSVSRSKW